MNKKSTISSFTGTALMFPMPSCTDLDETVYDKIPTENLGKTDGEVNSIIGPAYNTFRRYSSDACIASPECSGDMAVVPTRKGGNWYDDGQYRGLHMYAWITNTSAVKNAWPGSAEMISACNLTHETISTSALEESIKTRTLAGIRGARAFWIYYLMDNQGNVPLSIDCNDAKLPTCKTRKEVYNRLVREVSKIRDLLREDVSDVSYGKFIKGAVYTLLVKLYLNVEAWGVDSPQYKKTADACDAVMELPCVLGANRKTSFQISNQQSREAILACCFNANDTEWQNQLHYRTLHYKDNTPLGATLSTWNGTCAQPNYILLFDRRDFRYEGSFLVGLGIDPATRRVLIMTHDRPLIHTPEVTVIPGTERDGAIWGGVSQENGARYNRWTFDKFLTNAMESDLHISRPTDVYLMKAECLTRIGGNNAETTCLADAVCERVHSNSDHNYASVDLERIALERKFELVWECHARQDNIRFGAF